MPGLTPIRYRRVTYSDLRSSARRSRGFGDDCVMPGAVGPLAPGQVYCDPSTLADLAALNTLPVNNQSSLTQSLQGNPLTYALSGSGTCFSFAFPWIGTPDGSGNCVPAGGIPSATGTIITVLALGFIGIKILGAFK